MKLVDEDDEAKPKTRKYGRELTFAAWLLAWHAYALAAAALGQMSYPSALIHMQIIAQIASNAHAEGRTEVLAVIYDRLVRYAPVSCAALPLSVGRSMCVQAPL